jgi:hypothetical protein
MSHVTISRPRFGKIPAATAYSGLGRTKLYEEAAANPGLFRKAGAATIVDFDVLDAILEQLPPAKISMPKSRRGRHHKEEAARRRDRRAAQSKTSCHCE